MVRQIIHIDEEKCNGCGLCANACHEGAIDIVDGKAKLMREHFCDGLGDCLPGCPTGAITFEKREAPEYDEKAVLSAKKEKELAGTSKNTVSVDAPVTHQCPGTMMRQMNRNNDETVKEDKCQAGTVSMKSQLQNWPVQIKLAPITAPYFDGAKLLIAADCTAYAYASFHKDFIRNKVTLIGCPKLDDIDYSKKLKEIIRNNNIISVTVVRMEVPCCGGLENAAKKALQESGKFIPWQVVTIGIEGEILD